MQITGKLGDVMQESVKAAKSFVRSKCLEYGIIPPVFEKRDFAPIIQSTAGDYTASLSSSIIGTTNEVGVTTDGSGNIVIGLTDNVTIPSNLTVTNDLDLTGGNVNVIGDISASGNITASNIHVLVLLK